MSKRSDTWMPLYIGDYLRDTSRLTTEGHGAYMLLIFDYWVSARALPDDDGQLAAVTRLSVQKWKALRPVIATFFRVAEGLWHHKRIDAELAAAAASIGKRTKSGKEGAEKRWQSHGNRIPIVPDSDAIANAPSPSPVEVGESLAESSESPPRAQAAPPADGYAFRGAVIRLKQDDFNRWKASFSAIPDLTAELETIDAKLVDEHFEGKWFGRVSAWLRSRHEGLLRQNGSGGAATMSDVEQWRVRLAVWHDMDRGGPVRDRWRDVAWGPAPGEVGCLVPLAVLAEFNPSPERLAADLRKLVGEPPEGGL